MARKKLYRHTFKKAGTYRTTDGREVHTTEGGAVNGPKEMFESHPDIESRATKVTLPDVESTAQKTETTEAPAKGKGTSATKTKK